MRKILFLLIITFSYLSLFSQGVTAKRDFRCAWIATVTNIDWPPTGTVEAQKAMMISMLDNLSASGINAVFFQVRTECDALYNSPFEPWSYWLTGTQGKAPSPAFDPLAFTIYEGHKRGIEVHAWINPYRAEKVIGAYTLSANHVVKQHPEWIVTYSTLKVLNPGIPAVRDYDLKIIMDIVRRYDLDGIHFDDYFYPYVVSGVTFNDDATFASYGRGFTNKADWRRDNVNLLVKMVHDSIQAVKPWVKFGISPFGIWKSGYPSGISGMSAYDEIYCDALAWLNQKTVDYITPQLYWAFGGGQDYGKLMPWWGSQAAAAGRHFYPGHAIYRMVSSGTWPVTEVLNQINLDRNSVNCQGSVLYSSTYLTNNTKGLADSLKAGMYKYRALWPVMKWKDTLAPNQVQNLRYEKLASTGGYGLKWDQPAPAADEDQGAKFVIYKFANGNVSQTDIDNPANIFWVNAETEFVPKAQTAPGTCYFAVTALDHYGNEGKMSNVVKIDPPSAPQLAVPVNNAINQRDTVVLKWNSQNYAAAYYVQLSDDSLFQTVLFAKDDVTDTTCPVTGLAGQQKYFWRVKSKNAAGWSDFGNVVSFTTGFPVKPVLAEPKHATLNVTVNPTCKWFATPLAVSYRFQLTSSITVIPQTILWDSTGITDTAIAFKNLIPNKSYFWRVSAYNQYGMGLWSGTFGFKTETSSSVKPETAIPTEFSLDQNYPNPFNPSTTIAYHIAKPAKVMLKVYNTLGKEVAVLVNEFKNPGNYSVEFNAKLSSGVYYYTIKAGEFNCSRKMIILK